MAVDVDTVLMQLRIQLYGASQLLKGEALAKFWELIDELELVRPTPESVE